MGYSMWQLPSHRMVHVPPCTDVAVTVGPGEFGEVGRVGQENVSRNPAGQDARSRSAGSALRRRSSFPMRVLLNSSGSRGSLEVWYESIAHLGAERPMSLCSTLHCAHFGGF